MGEGRPMSPTTRRTSPFGADTPAKYAAALPEPSGGSRSLSAPGEKLVRVPPGAPGGIWPRGRSWGGLPACEFPKIGGGR